MKNRIINFIKRRWLLTWIIVSSAFTFGMVSYAEYLSEYNYIKRVVVSATELGIMFSSNYLVEGGGDAYQPKPEAVNEEKRYNVNVYLWNYNLKNPAQCYPGEISYTVQVRITNVKGEPITDASVIGDRTIIVKDSLGNVKAELNSSNLSSALTFSGSIEDGNGASSQTQYVITFDGWELADDSDICIQMIAKPDKTIHKDLRDIGAVIGMKEAKDPLSSAWQATVSEIQKSVTSADGYNLVLTGSGKATIELKWNSNYIDINQYFRPTDSTIYSFQTGELEVSGPDASGWYTMTINADSSKYRKRYNIQAYLIAGEKPTAGFFAEDGSSGAESAWITYKITSNN